MNNESQKKDRRAPFENAGRRVDEEIEKLISFLNDEVVPSVREHSTKGMRAAAEQLNRLADYMEQKRPPEPPSHGSESDEGATKS